MPANSYHPPVLRGENVRITHDSQMDSRLEAGDDPADSLPMAPIFFVCLVFLGFLLMDMSHDMLLIPTRSLLNDQLPESQIDEVRSNFSSFSSYLNACQRLRVMFLF